MEAPDTTVVPELLGHARFEVLPLPGAADQVASLPADGAVTVTCSPRRGLEPTLALVEELAAAGRRAVPHLAARQIRDERHLAAVVRRLHAAGVTDVFVVGGDAPVPLGDFDSGLGLLGALAAIGAPFDRVGVPAYPEGHPAIDDDTLLAVLAAKQRHATYLVTQMSFDAAAILPWLRGMRAAGVTLPAYLGLPGLVEPATLLRTALRIGVGDSRRFLSSHRRFARGLLARHLTGDLASALAAGVTPADGVLGVHLYTFNRITPTAAWLATARG